MNNVLAEYQDMLSKPHELVSSHKYRRMLEDMYQLIEILAPAVDTLIGLSVGHAVGADTTRSGQE